MPCVPLPPNQAGLLQEHQLTCSKAASYLSLLALYRVRRTPCILECCRYAAIVSQGGFIIHVRQSLSSTP